MKKRKILKFKKKKTDNELENYPLVEIKWLDIISESSWSSIKEVKEMELPVCITKGHLLSQTKGVTRVFGDYAEDDNGDLDDLGNVTLIPTSVILSIKKIVDKS
jgi:hypothetical protein|tara:strand:- start:1112 stop:1423 length:312 start_codon:yes stop_codon:yes gene_type:complete